VLVTRHRPTFRVACSETTFTESATNTKILEVGRMFTTDYIRWGCKRFNVIP